MIDSKSTAPSQISCSWLNRKPASYCAFLTGNQDFTEKFMSSINSPTSGFLLIAKAFEMQICVVRPHLREAKRFPVHVEKKIRLISVLTNIPHSFQN